MAIEIVDFPIKNGGSFHSYVTVYQRVCSGDDLEKGAMPESWVSLNFMVNLGKFHHDRALFSRTLESCFFFFYRGVIPKWAQDSGEREILFHLPRRMV